MKHRSDGITSQGCVSERSVEAGPKDPSSLLRSTAPKRSASFDPKAAAAVAVVAAVVVAAHLTPQKKHPMLDPTSLLVNLRSPKPVFRRS